MAEYAFEHANGYWQHRSVQDFRNEAHAREWAERCGITFRGRFVTTPNPSAPGSASWCETQGDNR